MLKAFSTVVCIQHYCVGNGSSTKAAKIGKYLFRVQPTDYGLAMPFKVNFARFCSFRVKNGGKHYFRRQRGGQHQEWALPDRWSCWCGASPVHHRTGPQHKCKMWKNGRVFWVVTHRAAFRTIYYSCTRTHGLANLLSASEVMTLWRYTNMFIIIIIYY